MGYACINMQLSSQKPKVYTGRSMIKRTFKSKGITYASELGLQNCKDLFEIIKWNHENGFNFFRICCNKNFFCFIRIDPPAIRRIVACLKITGFPNGGIINQGVMKLNAAIIVMTDGINNID